MEFLPGGRAPGGRCPRNVDYAQLTAGIAVEMEHTPDPRIAREIACDHLTEDPSYYTKLATIHLDGVARRRRWWLVGGVVAAGLAGFAVGVVASKA